MLTRRRIAFVPTLDSLSSRIAPSAVAVAAPTDPTADVASGDSSDATQDPNAFDPSQNSSASDPSQPDDPANDSPSPADFNWTPFCAVEDYPPVNLPS